MGRAWWFSPEGERSEVLGAREGEKWTGESSGDLKRAPPDLGFARAGEREGGVSSVLIGSGGRCRVGREEFGRMTSPGQ